MLIKKISTIILIVYLFFSGFNPEALYYSIKQISPNSAGGHVVDKLYIASQNKNVVDNFFATQRAHAAVNAAEKEYVIDVGPVNGSTTANYVYTAFFNPSASGRTASIKRIAIRSNTASSTASNYVNLSLRRISAASAGTQITATNFPKKNASSSDSVVEVRHTGVTVTLSGTVDSRILGMPLSGAVGSYYSYRDMAFSNNDEKIILQQGEGIAVYQEAAGTAATKVRVTIEWDETTNAPTAGSEFLFAFPRVEVAATANYVYNSFFNPSGSGKTAVVRRIWFGSETCDAAAVYTNNIVLKRTSAASAGTAVSAANIPKKNTSSSDSAMEFRHTNVTATQVGGTDARLGHVTPCGTTAQATGWQRIDFQESDEELILQQGEGIALISEGAGNANQIVRMIIEWDEVSSGNTPTSQGEYIWASSKVAAATVANTNLYTFFNPSGSGKTMVIKRLAIYANATTTSTYTSLQWRRITAASGGTLIATSSLPKKNTSSATSSVEIRWCLQDCSSAVTATYSGTADSRLLSVTAPGAVGQTIGQREIVFGSNEKIILQPGEGIGLYNDVITSSAADAVKVLIEWGEQASTPSSQGEYLIDVGPINGNTAATYNYVTFFNPAASGVNAVIKRVSIRVDAVAAALYIPMQLRRITAASAGTQVTAANIPKKHTGTANSAMEIRRTGVTATLDGTTDSKLVAVQTPGAVAGAAAGNTGYKEVVFTTGEPIVLLPGQGIALYQDAAGDADFRVKVIIEWGEQASAPTSLGEYLMTTGPITQSATAGYVYSTLFNPLSSAKNYIVRRVAVLIDRTAAATNPTYTPATVRRITAASAGTLVATTSIPRKHGSTATSSAEVRTTNVTATLAGSADSRVLGVTTPGVVNQVFGDYESITTYGDELVLQPGEGLALYQEQTNGDTNIRYRFLLEWKEESNAAPPQSITFTISTSSVYLGTVSSVQPRYASSTNTGGSGTEVEAHTLSVITNATNGYTVTALGDTLTSASGTIAAIGNTNTAIATGTEQFGIRLTASGGSGSVSSPYAASGFAYGGSSTTPTQIASATVGDNATTTYSLRYLVNIAPTTAASSYTTSIVYIATANF